MGILKILKTMHAKFFAKRRAEYVWERIRLINIFEKMMADNPPFTGNELRAYIDAHDTWYRIKDTITCRRQGFVVVDPELAHHIIDNCHLILEFLYFTRWLHLLCSDDGTFEKVTFFLVQKTSPNKDFSAPDKCLIYERAQSLCPEVARKHQAFYADSIRLKGRVSIA